MYLNYQEKISKSMRMHVYFASYFMYSFSKAFFSLKIMRFHLATLYHVILLPKENLVDTNGACITTI